MKVEWTAEASAELDHMLAYIAAQDTRAAALVAERVQKVGGNIATFPKAGLLRPLPGGGIEPTFPGQPSDQCRFYRFFTPVGTPFSADIWQVKPKI